MEACAVVAATKRGRPKGSGIDDRDRIDRIVAILTAEPYLSASAAIRRVVGGDPSTVRRIRDKLGAEHPTLINRTAPFGR